MAFLWTFLFFFLFSFSSFAEENLCGPIFMQEGSLDLNDNERILVCGEAGGAWDSIPLPQAELHLRSILQNLGYLSPRFERAGNRLNVWTGPKTEIQSFKIEGADGVLDASKKRKIVGFPLIPEKLNEVEAWANLKVRSQGYACPTLKVEAQAWDGALLLQSQLGSKKKYGNILLGDLEGLIPEVMDRYRPFETGEIYDVRETQIMTGRILADGLFQSAYFITECEGETAQLQLHTSLGKPRIVRVGFGSSTEEFPFVDLSFRNARLDDKASSITATLHASPRLQSLTLGSELYWFPGWYRTFVGPRVRIARESESAFATETAKLGVDLGRNWDLWDIRFTGRWGPTLNVTKTLRGVGPENANYPTFDGTLLFMSHNYEHGIRDQFEGWNGNFFYRGQNQGLGSKVDANRYEFRLKHLWNIGELSPPFLVLGTRLEGIIVDADSPENVEVRTLLPIEDRVYVGGDLDLRGFPRQGINNQGLGYLTFMYFGLELRLIEQLPYRLQPFLLWDFGKVGDRRYSVDPPVLTSEGVGIRWASPFGTLRGSAARGRIFNVDETIAHVKQGWVYFFSFGQEF